MRSKTFEAAFYFNLSAANGFMVATNLLVVPCSWQVRKSRSLKQIIVFPVWCFQYQAESVGQL